MLLKNLVTGNVKDAADVYIGWRWLLADPVDMLTSSVKIISFTGLF